MASRRRSRPDADAPSALPADLAIGPCIEDWTEPSERFGSNIGRALAAKHRWADAVESWALETGWASAQRPASNARNLARYHHPWSRDFLLARGEAEFVDWLEGRIDSNPGREGRPHGRPYVASLDAAEGDHS